MTLGEFLNMEEMLDISGPIGDEYKSSNGRINIFVYGYDVTIKIDGEIILDNECIISPYDCIITSIFDRLIEAIK